MYDPVDFASGIDQLAQAESRGDIDHRKVVLELMLADLATVGGNLADELTDYIADLSLFDDPVDLLKLGRLHADMAALWGSSVDYELIKSEARVKYLLPSAKRGNKVLKGASTGGSTRSVWKQKTEEMQQAVDSICADTPQHSYERIKQLANQKHGYPMSALKRYTKNPHKK